MISIKDLQNIRGQINDSMEKILNEYEPEPLMEKAPPGREDQVKVLKKEMCGGKDDCPEAFATAWKQHKKSK